MKTVREYKNSIEAFAHMDPGTSWVSFSREQVAVNNRVYDVLLPQVYQKPSRLMRIIQWVFCRIFWRSCHLDTARNLNACFRGAHIVLPREEMPPALAQQMADVTGALLQKLKNASPYRYQIDQYDQALKNDHARSVAQNKIRESSGNQELQQPGCMELVYAMDWNKDDPVLFDLAYATGQRFQEDLKSELINPIDCTNIAAFVRDLIRNDRYRSLTMENTTQLRQMVLAILNTLNARREEPDFQQLFATTIFQMAEALTHCSNGINGGFEKIFMDLTFPKDGALGRRVKLVLQALRDKIFRAAILDCIKASDRRDYYLSHEAATVNYYFGRLARVAGLPDSICAKDRNHEYFALKGQERNIADRFDAMYTPERILKEIYEKIHDNFDSAIPTRLFTEWVQAQRFEEPLEEDGTYKPETVLRLLQELQILKARA